MWNSALKVSLAFLAFAHYTADAQYADVETQGVETMADVETMAAARVLAEKRPLSAFLLWRAANYDKVQKEVKTKDVTVVGKKIAQYWKALKPADKAKFEADAKKQKEKYAAFLATDAGKKALAAQKEALKAKKMKKAKRAVKAVPKSDKLKRPNSAYFMFVAENRKKAKGKDIAAVGKELGAMWKKLSDKEKKPYVDKAVKAKTDHEAYLKSAAGLKVLGDYNAALKPVKEKLMKLRRPPAKAKPKKKKAKKAKKPKKAKKAKKPKKVKAKAKPKKKAVKAKSKKLSQLSSFDIGIPFAMLIGFFVSVGFSRLYLRRRVSAMSTEPLLS